MKTYLFIYQDRKGNELAREEWIDATITEARKIARKKLANSMMNDLYGIKVKVK